MDQVADNKERWKTHLNGCWLFRDKRKRRWRVLSRQRGNLYRRL